MKRDYKNESKGLIERIMRDFQVKLNLENSDSVHKIYLVNRQGRQEKQLFNAITWKDLYDKLSVFIQAIQAHLYFRQTD